MATPMEPKAFKEGGDMEAKDLEREEDQMWAEKTLWGAVALVLKLAPLEQQCMRVVKWGQGEHKPCGERKQGQACEFLAAGVTEEKVAEEEEAEEEGSLEVEVEVGTAASLLVHPRLRKYSRFVFPTFVAGQCSKAALCEMQTKPCRKFKRCHCVCLKTPLCVPNAQALKVHVWHAF